VHTQGIPQIKKEPKRL